MTSKSQLKRLAVQKGEAMQENDSGSGQERIRIETTVGGHIVLTLLPSGASGLFRASCDIAREVAEKLPARSEFPERRHSVDMRGVGFAIIEALDDYGRNLCGGAYGLPLSEQSKEEMLALVLKQIPTDVPRSYSETEAIAHLRALVGAWDDNMTTVEVYSPLVQNAAKFLTTGITAADRQAAQFGTVCTAMLSDVPRGFTSK